MDRYELKSAAKAQDALERAERDLEAIVGYEIEGISIHHVDRHGGDPINLRKGLSGTGSISSIGFPDGLKTALNAAMLEYFRAQVNAHQDTLAALGINIAA